MFDASCIFYQDVAGIVVALGNAVLHQFPKRNREILVGKLLPGAVEVLGGIWDAFLETMLSRLMLCLSICPVRPVPWNLNTLSKGKCIHGRYTEHVSFVCPYGYTNGGFAIEQTRQSGFQVQTFAAPGRR